MQITGDDMDTGHLFEQTCNLKRCGSGIQKNSVSESDQLHGLAGNRPFLLC